MRFFLKRKLIWDNRISDETRDDLKEIALWNITGKALREGVTKVVGSRMLGVFYDDDTQLYLVSGTMTAKTTSHRSKRTFAWTIAIDPIDQVIGEPYVEDITSKVAQLKREMKRIRTRALAEQRRKR